MGLSSHGWSVPALLLLLLVFATCQPLIGEAAPRNSLAESLFSTIRHSFRKVTPAENTIPRRRSLKAYTVTSSRQLDQPLHLTSLTRVPLDYFHEFQTPQPEDEGAISAKCHGGQCPEFKGCGVRFPSLKACWNPQYVDPFRGPGTVADQRRQLHLLQKRGRGNPLDLCLENSGESPGDLLRPGCPAAGEPADTETRRVIKDWEKKWAGQVFVLENVYVNWRGQVFNETHLFDPSGCVTEANVSYPAGTHVTMHRDVVNLLSDVADPRAEVFHELTDLLPMMLPLKEVLPKLKDAVIVARSRKLLSAVANRVLKLPVTDHEVQGVKPGLPHLWYVQKLYQPVRQQCRQPSMALWTQFRSNHLLPRGSPQVFRDTGSESADAESAAGLAAGVPEDWVVVVAADVAGRVDEAGEIRDALKFFFPEDRIVLFKNNLNVLEAKDLFNRAALFVATSTSALAHVMFMPPNATVLELRAVLGPNIAQKTASVAAVAADPDLPTRQLSEACGLRHYQLLCAAQPDPKSANGNAPLRSRLSCDMWHVQDVIDRVSHDVYSSEVVTRATVRSIAGPAGGRFGLKQKLLGTKLRSGEEVRAFKDWMACIGKQGRWDYNATPRVLPWDYPGNINLCDHRHWDATQGLMKKEADEYARSGGAPEGWTVRETLKYEWRVKGSCPMPVQDQAWVPFQPQDFCNRVGKNRTILFLGDSLNEQFFGIFINQMLRDVLKPADWAVHESKPKFCVDWVNNTEIRHEYCRTIEFSDEVCPGLKILFIRSDHLWLGAPRHFSELQWTRMPEVANSDIIIINRGAHYTTNEVFEPEMRTVMTYLRNRWPQKLLIYRNSPPGHADCENATAPIPKRQDPSVLPYNWEKLAGQNEIARGIAEELGMVYMDVDAMTALRPDGHKGWKPSIQRLDCLHYCTPGPLDSWMDVLYNTLLRTLPLPR
ncbi:hypothetical protein CLOM_g13398 [Closterium sp. NIES-68]|nr:hypothetical protein CLOM_g13398 [Closterium sp. NIES-68]GJP72409.1 hypothetical protein CLOP_g3145 [Closterium sp. NIES-67]